MLVTDVRPDRHVPEAAVAPGKTLPPAAVRLSAPALRRAPAATVIRRRRVMLILVGSAALAAAAGGVTGATAGWIVAAVALVLAVVYQSVAAHMHHHAAERDIARAFGPGPSLDDAAWGRLTSELGLASSGDDEVRAAAGEGTAVALYAASLLLAWILTPVVGAIRLVRGNVTEQDEGLLGMLVRAQQYGRSQSLRVLSMSVVATAGVAGVGMAAPSAANASPSTATAVPASAVHAAATAQSPATAVRSSSTSSYTVRPGNTLTAIAAQYGTTVSALAAVNNLSDPNLILIGQVLQVPVPAYTVQPGDTLTSIGSRFGLTTTKLAAANRISDPDLILVGQVLHVHGGDLPAVINPKPAPSSTGAVLTASTHAAAAGSPTAATHPAAATKPAASSPTVTQSAPPLVGSGTYTVQTGDTLFALAAKFDTTVATLVEANQLSDNTILTGQVLQVGSQGANAARATAKPARATAKPAHHATAKPTHHASVEPAHHATAKPARRATAKPARATARPAHHATAKPVHHATAKPARATAKPAHATAKPARTTRTTTAKVTSAPAPTTPTTAAPATTSTTSSSSTSTGSSDSNQSSSSLEACIIRVESGGNPQAMSANGEYWGLFQFSKPTWIGYGGEAGEWGSASAAVQEQVFQNAIAAGGASNWTLYDGC